MTNAERIRSMTDEKLAEKISAHMDCYTCPLWNGNACYRKFCKNRWLGWLKEEAEDGVSS